MWTLFTNVHDRVEILPILQGFDPELAGSPAFLHHDDEEEAMTDSRAGLHDVDLATLRRKLAAAIDQLRQRNAESQSRLASLGRPDPIKTITGVSAIEHSLRAAERMLEHINALHTARDFVPDPAMNATLDSSPACAPLPPRSMPQVVVVQKHAAWTRLPQAV
jgi:hypothetical protein